jgi:hypothetical protein
MILLLAYIYKLIPKIILQNNLLIMPVSIIYIIIYIHNICLLFRRKCVRAHMSFQVYTKTQ